MSINKDKISFQDPNEYVLYELIISYILTNPRPDKQGEISRSEKSTIIRKIGNSEVFQNELGNKQKPTHYYTDLLQLHDHYYKFEDFSFEKVISPVLRNFACFLSKIDKFEELIDFTDSKGISNKEISYSFWCGYNGFSEISEKQSKIIFASEDLAIINSFDTFLRNTLFKLDQFSFDEGATKEFQTEENSPATSFSPDLDYSSVVSTSRLSESKYDLGEIEKTLSDLQLKIWRTSIASKFNGKQKDDVTAAVNETKIVVLESSLKGVEIYKEKKFILSVFKKKVQEINKKRKKAEYKISSDILDPLLSELQVLL